MKKTIAFISVAIALVACNMDPRVIETDNGELVKAIKDISLDKSSVAIGGIVDEVSGTAATKTVDSPTRETGRFADLVAKDTVLASFFLRIDNTKPDVNHSLESIYNGAPKAYYPSSDNFAERHSINSKIDMRYLRAKLPAADQSNFFYINPNGISDVCIFHAPSMEEMAAKIPAGKKITVWDKEVTNEDLTNDAYKVIWYAAKYISNDSDIHVDGCIMPAGNISYEFNLGVANEIVAQIDDFAIRKSILDKDEYVAYGNDKKQLNGELLESVNSFKYNNVVISRSKGKLLIKDVDKLDWSQAGTIYTFETHIWAKDPADPNKAAFTIDSVDAPAWKLDESGIIPDPVYLVKYNIYENYQSNGTVPYCKISIHVSKK